jgi:hypothetical protein
MATQIQLRRGTTAQHATFTGAVSEVTVDTDKDTVVVHDGSTVGGVPLATEASVDDRIQVANAAATFVTKSTALASNNAVKLLIDDRIQVANATSLFVNVSGDTMSGALAMGTNKITGMGDPTLAQDAATKTYVDTQVSGIVDAAPEALNTLNELAAALGDDSNFSTTILTALGSKSSNTYVNQTFETKSTALASNNAVKLLVDDRIQVANARVEFIQSSNTSINNDAASITVQQSNVDLEDRALVNPAGFITLNIGGTDYKLPFFS